MTDFESPVTTELEDSQLEVPTDAHLDAFIETLQSTPLLTHRMAFPRVDARRTNGHVQGIAADFRKRTITHKTAAWQELDVEHEVATMYLSVSDFPPGWSACLIEQGVSRGGTIPGAMETLALPQGRHSGGINIVDQILVVPMEHDDRKGRLYFYDLTNPLYPRQIGAIDDPPGPELSWPSVSNSQPSKASAAAMARMTGDWRPGSRSEAGPEYLVALLSEKCFLRFFRVTSKSEGEATKLKWTGEAVGGDAIAMVESPGSWPKGFVDNISLILTTGGWRLIVFSAHRLIPWIDLQRRSTIDRITVYDLDFPVTGSERRASLRKRAQVDVRLKKERPAGLPAKGNWRAGKHRPTVWCWPGVRWGASLQWTGSEFAVFMAEWFGDEESIPSGGQKAGAVMFVQFATNLANDPFGYEMGKGGAPPFGLGHANHSRRPPLLWMIGRSLRDAVPIMRSGLVALVKREWGKRRGERE